MFSAYRLSAKYVFTPKNGPVPDRGVNAYIIFILTQNRHFCEIAAKKGSGTKKWLIAECSSPATFFEGERFFSCEAHPANGAPPFENAKPESYC
ncbi:MAG: hypothetical protein IT426_06765 [Pirellulales bacterium]|nr:hypothetical protein [Pirellulales bacterium]